MSSHDIVASRSRWAIPELRYIADPIFYCETLLDTFGAASLAEHNDEELRERIGLGPEEITTLRARGII